MTLPKQSSFIRLETKGRKTGLSHVVELRYVYLHGSFFVIGGSSRNDWVLNALHSGKVRVRSAKAVVETSARLASDAERREASEEFAKKYGQPLFDQWYGGSGACLRLAPSGPPNIRSGTSGELDAKTTYEEWERNGRDFYADVADAFDLASEEYDFTISHNFINTWIRERSISILHEYVGANDTLLEVGCGTGAETIEVARRVSHIVATDISRLMVERLSAKAKARGLSHKVDALRLAAGDISEVSRYLGDRRVRVAYSFNGALNCEPRLGEFVDALYLLLEPGGYLICSIRNTICLSEMLSHALFLQFDKATPRKKQPSMVSVGGKDIPSTYFSPHRFIEFFKQGFQVRRVVALPALLPPAYLSNYYLRMRRGLILFERFDELASERFPFKLLGDQTLFVFQKKETRVSPLSSRNRRPESVSPDC